MNKSYVVLKPLQAPSLFGYNLLHKSGMQGICLILFIILNKDSFVHTLIFIKTFAPNKCLLHYIVYC